MRCFHENVLVCSRQNDLDWFMFKIYFLVTQLADLVMADRTAVGEDAGLCPCSIVRWNGTTQLNGLLWLKGVLLLCSALFPLPCSHLTYMPPVTPLEVQQLPLWLQRAGSAHWASSKLTPLNNQQFFVGLTNSTDSLRGQMSARAVQLRGWDHTAWRAGEKVGKQGLMNGTAPFGSSKLLEQLKCLAELHSHRAQRVRTWERVQ